MLNTTANFLMTKFSAIKLTAACAAMTLLSGSADAQLLRVGSNGQVVVTPGTVTVNPVPGQRQWQPIQQPVQQPIQQPVNRQPAFPPQTVPYPIHQHPGYYPIPDYAGRPGQPIVVTPDQFKGINPQTGGIDTGNTQVNDTALDFGRNGSANNGTRRWVRRPVYRNGQIVGYEEGYVWNNSFSGQEHGNLKVVTPNDKGGVHEQISIRSVPR